jgi:hypothetical protein
MIKLIDILSEEIENNLLIESSKAPSPIGPTHITDMYGIQRGSGTHRGIDLRAPVGTTVYSPGDGVVKSAVKVNETYNEIKRKRTPNGNDRCGSRVTIEHTSGPLNGLRTVFCHMSSINVTKGESVKVGDIIGTTGGARNGKGSGNTTGPHLHLGLKSGSDFLNPLDYFDLNKGFDNMVGGDQTTQEPISPDYGDETTDVTTPSKKYDLSDDGFNEFIEDNFTQQEKDEIDNIDVELKDRNIYYVVYRKNKPSMFYLFTNGRYKLQNI